MSHRILLAFALLLGDLFGIRAWTADPDTFRILTYNVHHGEGMDGRIDLERIAAVIRQSEPDLVALQEVDRGTSRSVGVDQAARLGQLTGMHVAFGRAMDYGGGQYGLAILSRFAMEDVRVHALPAPLGCEPRCVLDARVRLGADGHEVRFAATHLEHAQATARVCQAGKLSPAILGSEPLAAILAGDFNDVPDSVTRKVLLNHWTDTTDEHAEPTSPADKPRRKLDYVFFRPASGWRVVQTRVIPEPVASDHCPVLVILQRLP